MTTELEKKFFDAFGIKAKLDGSDFNKSIQANYPEITDCILLELIEIIIKRDFDTLKLYKVDGSYHGQFDTNIDHYFANYQKNNLKNLILHICQHNSKIFDHQVRELFAVNMTTNRKR